MVGVCGYGVGYVGILGGVFNVGWGSGYGGISRHGVLWSFSTPLSYPGH